MFSDQLSAVVAEKAEADLRLVFNLAGDAFDAALAQAGAMPLPPYIAAKRPADDRDRIDYQTVFARHSGAVAAPTASLHFDDQGNLILSTARGREAIPAAEIFF